ncbi:MAG: FHA domain-containing protein [Planctomycetota bacterium]|nr:FHA domain-containing protein [Planctomycetota bacterium]
MTFRLTFTLPGETAKPVATVDVAAGQPCLLGRNPKSQVFLSDPRVSHDHCRVSLEGGALRVEDLPGRGRTLINGKAVWSPGQLNDGDELSLNGLVLRVECRTLDGASPAKPAAAMPPIPRPPPVPRAPVPASMPADGSQTLVSPTRLRPVGPAAGPPVFTLRAATHTLGRDAECDLRLDNPAISRRHTLIRRDNDSWVVEDLRSSNGTFVNGLRVRRPRKLAVGDRMTVGPYRLEFDGTRLVSRRSEGGVRIAVRGIGKEVRNRETGKPLWLLNDITLTFEPREFIGLLGGSGCGKSTFLDTLNGRRPATRGSVLYDGDDLYHNLSALKSDIGYVPQDVILHEGLPVADALSFAARLRLPSDTSRAEIQTSIDRVLATVGLTERRSTLIRNLSGGQKKRVSIAMELLSRPRVLFLDEVTSGLDLGTERQMMELFRNLADDGHTIICITHHVDSLEMCDMVAHFMKGRLTFCGPPEAIKRQFGVEELREIYTAEASQKPEEWQQKFQQTPVYREFVQGRLQNDQSVHSLPKRRQPRRTAAPLRQFDILLGRYARLLTLDYRSILLNLALAPAIALLLCILAASIKVPDQRVTPDDFRQYATRQNILCFGAVTTVLFLGLFGSIREIVKELPIYRHERFMSLRVGPYVTSKIIPLAMIGALQSIMVAAIAANVGGLDASTPLQQAGLLFLASFAGTMMGLAVSAVAPSTDWAVILMIVVVIPQILFSGALVPTTGLAAVISKLFAPAYWGQQAMTGMLDETTRRLIDAHAAKGKLAWLSGAVMLPIHAIVYGVLSMLFLWNKDRRK